MEKNKMEPYGKISIDWDLEANALYYKFSDKKVERTEKDKTRDIDLVLDYDKNHELVGIEVLNLKRALRASLSSMSLMFLPQRIQKKIPICV
ncbi:MAG: DUF2283 domain-containing protein [Candidatus Omnitrophica bacterium]|nr:DUF2283 domain-containing protein [Candidatus Nanoarchaeia archaeon]MDD5551277.1 DUF2283 domain-containing protein [Candidatus Omnitrophota bacterium]